MLMSKNVNNDTTMNPAIAVFCGYSRAAKYWPQVPQAHEWQSLRKRNIIKVCMGILSDRYLGVKQWQN